MKYRFLMLASLVLMSPAIGFAQGDVHPELSAKFGIDLGMFFPERTATLSAGVNTREREKIDFADEFGLEKHHQTFSLDADWRFGEKWSLSAQYFATSGKKTAVLDEDVEWNGEVFGAGSSVRASTGFTLYRAFVGRRFGDRERTDLGFGLGLHWLELDAALAGDILVGDGVSFSREAVSASAPLPNIGAWYRYSMSPRWAFRARADWFSAAVDDYDGTLVNWQVGINYLLFPNAGLGLAYNSVHLDVGVDSPKWFGSVDLDYNGPFAFISIYW